MKSISSDELERIAAAGTILARDDGFLRAVRDGDGRIWKQFRKKSLPSTAAIWPYARRFVRAARLLQQRGISTVNVRAVYRVRETGRDVVVYDSLPGCSLRSALQRDGVQRLGDFAAYMALLHERGLYFRSMHLDNVLVLDDGGFALIDVAHVTFALRPLGPWRRARNFRPVTSYQEDRALLEQFGNGRFLDAYCSAAKLGSARQRRFLSHVARLNEHYKAAATSILQTGVAHPISGTAGRLRSP